MYKTLIILGIFIAPFCSCAQSKMNQQMPTTNENLWSKLHEEELSDDGQWISYVLRHEHKNGNLDTLHIKHINKPKHFKFSEAYNLSFAPNNDWAYFFKNENLVLISLMTGDSLSIKNHKGFNILNEGNYITVIKENNKFHIFNNKLELVKAIEGIHKFFIAPNGIVLLNYSNGTSAILKEEQNFAEVEIPLSQGRISELQWSNDGTSIAYLLEDHNPNSASKDYSVNIYNFSTRTAKKFPQQHKDGMAAEHKVVPWADQIIYHPEGKHVLFYSSNPKKGDYIDGGPEIWLSSSKKDWGTTNHVNRELYPLLSIWYPETGKFEVIDDGISEIKVTPNRDFAIFLDSTPYEPNYEVSGTADVYALNLLNGSKNEIVKKRAKKILTYGISSKGTYFYFIDKGDWWLHNLYTNEKRNLTQGMNLNWLDSSFDSGGYPEVNGDPAWSSDEKYFIVYDDFDIWYLAPDDSQKIKKTNGSQNKTKYRLYNRFKNGLTLNKFIDFRRIIWNTNQNLLVEAYNQNAASGLFLLNPKSTMDTIIWGKAKYSGFDYSSDFKTFSVTKQSYSIAPELNIISENKRNTVLKTNKEYSTDWRKVELLKYPYQKSDSLQAIVYFPKNWNPQKKYPAIVYVYEKLSHDYNKFWIPSLWNGTGFNPINFMEQDYFVILPDIKYTIGKPGESALNSVDAALDAILAKNWIQADKLGIIGHSFGSFETNYIIAHSNRFASAVSGAGFSNLVSSYLEFDENRHRNRMWKFENQQMRMGESLYDNFQNYLDNSAVYRAKNIQTPLLLWTGSDDKVVNPTQSMQLHLALGRLNKYNVLIRYPNEGHILQNPKNQEHLTEYVLDWFNTYLK